MISFNLTDVTKSDVKFKINKFPDGQQDVVITNFAFGSLNNLIQLPIEIKSRFSSFKDLELIICATKALRNIGVKEIHLFIPYVLGARSDRKFVEGGTSYLKDVVAPILNQQSYETVTVLDAHSDVTEACINNYVGKTNVDFVKWATREITNGVIYPKGVNPGKYPFLIVSPDAGAMKKIYNVASGIGYEDEIIIASKHRDIATGTIKETRVPIESSQMGNSYVIIDDICDGGRTFTELARAIRRKHAGIMIPKIYLIVTHGIFSSGFLELFRTFDKVYCTNSYKDIDDKETIIGCDIPVSNLVKQLNIF